MVDGSGDIDILEDVVNVSFDVDGDVNSSTEVERLDAAAKCLSDLEDEFIGCVDIETAGGSSDRFNLFNDATSKLSKIEILDASKLFKFIY